MWADEGSDFELTTYSPFSMSQGIQIGIPIDHP